MTGPESSAGDEGSDALLERPTTVDMNALLTLLGAQLGTAISPKVRDALIASVTPTMLEEARRQADMQGESNQPLSIVLILLQRLGLDTALGKIDTFALEAIFDKANTAVQGGDARSIFEGIKRVVGQDKGEIRRLLNRQPIRKGGESVGRNDRCPCGSGKKYKQCCMKKS